MQLLRAVLLVVGDGTASRSPPSRKHTKVNRIGSTSRPCRFARRFSSASNVGPPPFEDRDYRGVARGTRWVMPVFGPVGGNRPDRSGQVDFSPLHALILRRHVARSAAEAGNTSTRLLSPDESSAVQTALSSVIGQNAIPPYSLRRCRNAVARRVFAKSCEIAQL